MKNTIAITPYRRDVPERRDPFGWYDFAHS